MIVGNNTGKVGYFDICMTSFHLLDVYEAMNCVLPIVEHIKNKQSKTGFKYNLQTNWKGQSASDNMQ